MRNRIWTFFLLKFQEFYVIKVFLLFLSTKGQKKKKKMLESLFPEHGETSLEKVGKFRIINLRLYNFLFKFLFFFSKFQIINLHRAYCWQRKYLIKLEKLRILRLCVMNLLLTMQKIRMGFFLSRKDSSKSGRRMMKALQIIFNIIVYPSLMRVNTH